MTLVIVPRVEVSETAGREGGAARRELEEGLPLLTVQSHQHVHKSNQG